LPLKTRDDLSMAYTPGVARVSMAIHDDPAKAWALTIKANTVAVVSDGTAVAASATSARRPRCP
jgi:malate dehydrogenase (oxaloacetate-decarboxylating)